MNNLPLQPLVWFDCKDGTGADTVTVICEYDIYKYGDERIRCKEEITGGEYSLDSWVVAYYNRHTEAPTKEEAGFATIDEAKAWAWNHYNEKMQPYVKPMPTWIDASERLPESECFYLVRLFDGHRDEHVFVILWWNAEHQQFLEWDAMCEPTHWMPIPEFSNMQNNKGE